MENLLPPFIRITPDAYVGSEASSIARFLCLGGFWRWLSSRRAGGGVPTRSRARRFASFQPRNCSFAGGLVGLIGMYSLPAGRIPVHGRVQWSLAEVCRNRTDRSTGGRSTGFEVPGGHQPTCTSVMMLNESLLIVNATIVRSSGFVVTECSSVLP